MTPGRKTDGIQANSGGGRLTEPPMTRQNRDDQAGAWRETQDMTPPPAGEKQASVRASGVSWEE